MDERFFLLRIISNNQFGIRPTKNDLISNLVINYGCTQKEAEQIYFLCVRDHLISVDTITQRISMENAGVNLLNKKPDDTFAIKEAENSIPEKVVVTQKSDTPIWNRYSVIIPIVLFVLGLGVTLFVPKCSSNKSQLNQDSAYSH